MPSTRKTNKKCEVDTVLPVILEDEPFDTKGSSDFCGQYALAAQPEEKWFDAVAFFYAYFFC